MNAKRKQHRAHPAETQTVALIQVHDSPAGVGVTPVVPAASLRPETSIAGDKEREVWSEEERRAEERSGEPNQLVGPVRIGLAEFSSAPSLFLHFSL